MLIILPFGIFSLSNKPGVILTPCYQSRVKTKLIAKKKNDIDCKNNEFDCKNNEFDCKNNESD